MMKNIRLSVIVTVGFLAVILNFEGTKAQKV